MRRTLRIALALSTVLGSLGFGTLAHADNSCSPMNQSSSGAQPYDQLVCCDGNTSDDGCGPCQCPYCGDSCSSTSAGGPSDDGPRSVGSPVDPMTGFMFFTDTDVNVALPVGPPIRFDRSYSTAWAESHGGRDEIGILGPGWGHRYSARLDLVGASPATSLTYRRWNTSSAVFTQEASGAYSATDPGQLLTFDSSAGQYTLQQLDGSIEVFDSSGALRIVEASDSGEAQLVYVNDDAACTAGATRPVGQLCRVDFLNGQQLWFSYAGTPLRLATVSWDSAGANPVVNLTYDSSGYLLQATGADNATTTYAYAFTHTFYAFPGSTVNLITTVTDPDGVLRESFEYIQPANTPSKVSKHQTPDDTYKFGYAGSGAASTNPRKSVVTSTRTNIQMSWAEGRLATVCYENDDATTYLEHCTHQILADGGAPLATCVIDSQGRSTAYQRDAYGRPTSVTNGVANCDAVTPAELQYEVQQGYVGTGNQLAFQSWVSIDPSAPAGFRSAHVWDHTQPSSATDPLCDSGSCLGPSAYNQGTLEPVVEQDVRVGRTLGDLDGGWITQVQVIHYTYGLGNQLTGTKGPRTDLDDSITRAYFATTTGDLNAGRLQSISRGSHPLVQYANYNQFGEAQTLTDENGGVTQTSYDAVGRILSVQAPDGSVTGYSYLPSGKLQTVTLPKGNTIQYGYDATGPLDSVKHQDATGDVVEEIDYFHQNGGSQVTGEQYSASAGGQRAALYSYDFEGRRNVVTLFQVPNVDAIETGVYSYSHFNEAGEIDWVADSYHAGYDSIPGIGSIPDTSLNAASHNEEYLYDMLGRLARFQKLVQGQWYAQTAFAYDVQSHITQVVDATGIATTYTYDDFGRLVASSSPDSGIHTYVYDTAGNLIAERRPDGTVLNRTYDDRNRLLTVIGGGVAETYAYDGTAAPALTDCATGAAVTPTYGKGRLTSVTDAAGTWVWGYTALGQEAFEGLQSVGGTCAKVYRWSYDANGNPATMTYPSGHSITYVYPAAGTDGDPDVANGITFTGGGRTLTLAQGADIVQGTVEAWTAGNGYSWSFPRNLDGSPTTLTISKVDALSGQTMVVRQRGFGFIDAGFFQNAVDLMGNPIGMVEDDPTRSQTFGYDQDRDFLNGAAGPYGGQSFGYENSGDRLSDNDAGYCYQQGTHRLITAGATQFTYGPAGEAWTITADGGETTLCYDAEQRVTTTVGPGGEAIVDRRDFRHQLAAEVEPLNGLVTDYRFGPAGQLWSESGYGTLTSQYPRATTEYVYLADQPIAMVQSEEQGDGGFTVPAVVYLFGGHLGEPYLEADENGDVVRSYDFEPFGNRAEGPNPKTVSVNESVTGQTGSFSTDVHVPGAFSMQLHFTSHNFGGCPLQITGPGGVSLAQIDDTLAQDAWTPGFPGDGVTLSIPSCAGAYSFTIDVAQGTFGAATVTPLSLQTSSPYPPTGQQFTLNLAEPSFLEFTNIGLASCDSLEARDHASQQVLWTSPAGFGAQSSPSAGWTPALSGQVDVGIWGQGCNSTEGAMGFALSDEVAATYSSPSRSLLPGQIKTGGQVSNWNRVYRPAEGRYLESDPLLSGTTDYAQWLVAHSRPATVFGYGALVPVRFVDPTGAGATSYDSCVEEFGPAHCTPDDPPIDDRKPNQVEIGNALAKCNADRTQCGKGCGVAGQTPGCFGKEKYNLCIGFCDLLKSVCIARAIGENL